MKKIKKAEKRMRQLPSILRMSSFYGKDTRSRIW